MTNQESLLSSLGAVVECGVGERYLNIDIVEPCDGRYPAVDCFVSKTDFLDFRFKLYISTPALVEYPASELAPICVVWLSGQKDPDWVLSQLRQVRWGREMLRKYD